MRIRSRRRHNKAREKAIEASLVRGPAGVGGCGSLWYFGDEGEARGGARAFQRGAGGAAEARAARCGWWLLGERRMNGWMWKGGR